MHTCQPCGFAGNADADHFCNRCGAELREPAPVVSEGHDETMVDRAFAGTSDIGRRHERNEDAIAARLVEAGGDAHQVLVLCDGVSTSFRPETASQVAVSVAIEEATRCLEAGNGAPAALRAGLVLARDAVACLEGEPGRPRSVPATTIVMAIVGPSRRVDYGWLGDSRLYWLSPAGSRQLTRDDSWSNDATPAERRALTPDQIHARAHAITKCLGARPPGLAPFEPHLSVFEMPAGGVLLAATDGFYGDMPEPDDMRVLAVGMGLGVVDALTLSRNLVTFSNNRGGRDNISVIVLLVDEPPTADPASSPSVEEVGV